MPNVEVLYAVPWPGEPAIRRHFAYVRSHEDGERAARAIRRAFPGAQVWTFPAPDSVPTVDVPDLPDVPDAPRWPGYRGGAGGAGGTSETSGTDAGDEV